MSPSRPARRSPTLRSFEEAEGLVRIAFLRWVAGESPRLVRKWLRKRGLHPWSLLFCDQLQASLERLHSDFRVPTWMQEALQWTPWHYGFGLILEDPERPRRLPEGLVTPYLGLQGTRHLRRLPRRLWTQAMVFDDLPRLGRLDGDRRGLLHLEVVSCPALRSLTLPADGSLNRLLLRDCPQLDIVPALHARTNPLPRLQLLRMPRLRAVGTGARLESLFAWHCKSLQDLAGLSVKASLQLHDCPNLRTLPPVSDLVRLEVTACPSLLALPHPIGDSVPGRFDPHLAPAGPISSWSLREPETQATPLFPEDPIGFAWPYPPPEPENPSERRLLQTVAALALPPFEEFRALATLLGHPAPAARLLLRQTDFPPEAVYLACTWLDHLVPMDLPPLRAILSQVEALGLGAQSLATLCSDKQLEAFGLLAAPCPGETNREAHLVGPWVASLNEETAWRHDLHLRSVEGALRIAHCPSLAALPRRLDVDGDLVLRNLPRLGPCTTHARISGQLVVEGVPPEGLSGLKIIPPVGGDPG